MCVHCTYMYAPVPPTPQSRLTCTHVHRAASSTGDAPGELIEHPLLGASDLLLLGRVLPSEGT